MAQRRLARRPARSRASSSRRARIPAGRCSASASTSPSTRRTLPPDAAEVAGTLGLSPDDVEPTLTRLLEALERRLGEESPVTLAALRERDALLGKPVKWQDGEGTGAGIDDDGALRVTLDDGSTTTLSAGEVTLTQRDS